MASITRRRFLISGSLGFATAVIGISFDGGTSWCLETPLSGRPFDFRAVTLGMDGGAAEGPLHGKPASLVTEINFKSGDIRQTQIPIVLPHAPQYLPGDRIFALAAHSSKSLVLDQNHRILKTLEVPSDFAFAGHSLVLEDLGWLVISVKKKVSRTLQDTGYLWVLDLKTLETKEKLATLSTFSHDIVRISKTEIALSHYGTVLFDFQPSDRPVTKNGVTFLMDVQKPMISYIAVPSLKFNRHVELDPTFALNHIALAPGGGIYGIYTQGIAKDENGLKYSMDRYKDPNIAKQKTFEGSGEQYMFLPSPLSITTSDQKTQSFMTRPVDQLRGHDIVSDSSSNWLAATFPGSGTVGVLKNRESIELYPGSKWGLESPRAIGLSPDKKMILITDYHRGIVVVDRTTLKTEARVDLPVFKTVHIDSKPV